jgi:NitT/TauT family transport system ATP-binding protein
MEFSDVSKSFGSDAGVVHALTGVDLPVTRGDFVSVVGPSGCGKTTLLNLAAGLDRPSGGKVSILDRIVSAPVTDVGIVFQEATLMDWRTVLENVLLQIQIRKLPLAQFKDKAIQLLEDFGLGQFLHAYPSQLSGGMKQRVSIVRALIHKPSLLLMDEPFSALDALTRDKLNVDMQRLCLAEGTTTLFITHSISDAVLLADRVVVMTPRPGRVAEVLDIDLPKPRPLSVRETPEFAAYTGRIRSIFEREGVL